MAFKRVLTDELRDSLAASNASPHSMLDDDITVRLRSVGSCIRKNVMEGYISAPPSFSKSNSTGTIFQSARDSLREAQSLSVANSSASKRSRPQGGSGYDSDGAIDEDRDAEMDKVNSEGDRTPVNPEVSSRPTKPLRKPRKAMLQTRSLPSHSFAMSDPKLTNDVMMNKVEEEDWSTGDFAPQGFNPTQD
ncbi:hypothetical protein H2248_006354 [Termitomyces sp. 'cryptogamus']|nr:hypothetical protein H2248_006354 [Termitomyces sp. 'cryptogamus']